MFFGMFFKVLVLLGLVVILIFLGIGNFKLNQKRQSFNSILEKLKNEVEEVRQKKEVLQSKIKESQTQEYVEKIAREEYNLKKQGEKVVAFLPVKGEKGKIVKTEKEKSFWQKFLEKLKIK